MPKLDNSTKVVVNVRGNKVESIHPMWKTLGSLLPSEVLHMVPAGIGFVRLIGWRVTDRLLLQPPRLVGRYQPQQPANCMSLDH